MVLSGKGAACADVLGKLTQTIETILWYCAHAPTLEFDMLNRLTEPEMRPLFSDEKICAVVRTIYGLPKPERMEMYKVFYDDATFSTHIGDAAYQFSALPAAGSAALRELCDCLYDTVQAGMPTDKSAFAESEAEKQ